MEYGILLAVNGSDLQIIGPVSSPAEAREMALDYLRAAPKYDMLAPGSFEIHRKDCGGWYTVREPLAI